MVLCPHVVHRNVAFIRSKGPCSRPSLSATLKLVRSHIIRHLSAQRSRKEHIKYSSRVEKHALQLCHFQSGTAWGPATPSSSKRLPDGRQSSSDNGPSRE